MIGKLKGLIDSISTDHVLLDVQGVCYLVFCSAMTLRQLPSASHSATLHIETVVREDAIQLFGFYDVDEQEAFRELVKVSGVGNKMALSILSVMSPPQIAHAVLMQDKSSFATAQGVGPKMAARLVTELKDKFSAIPSMPSAVSSTAVRQISQDANAMADAVSALVNLGYARETAYRVVKTAIDRQPDVGVAELIRHGLKELSQ